MVEGKRFSVGYKVLVSFYLCYACFCFLKEEAFFLNKVESSVIK